MEVSSQVKFNKSLYCIVEPAPPCKHLDGEPHLSLEHQSKLSRKFSHHWRQGSRRAPELSSSSDLPTAEKKPFTPRFPSYLLVNSSYAKNHPTRIRALRHHDHSLTIACLPLWHRPLSRSFDYIIVAGSPSPCHCYVVSKRQFV